MNDFSNEDYWRAIILYGLNQATYKIALGMVLLDFAKKQESIITWETLSIKFFEQYRERLSVENPMPQQANPGRRTVMERIILQNTTGKVSEEEAASLVGQEAFGDVISRFHTLGNFSQIQGKFYEFDFGKKLVIKNSLFEIVQNSASQLESEIQSRWGLLEGAFSIRGTDYVLGNEILNTYLTNGYDRKPLTENVPFLQGYQGNLCFYCAEPILEKIHVDHVLPRQVLNHDEIWNLVLAHDFCNLSKSDQLVGTKYLEKLIKRNENIMGSNHPWKAKISSQLGVTPLIRATNLRYHYENVRVILGNRFWNGVPNYRFDLDPFFKKLITVMNNPNR